MFSFESGEPETRHFDAFEWEMQVASHEVGQNETVLKLAGILAAMADENGIVSLNPASYPDFPEAQELALMLSSEGLLDELIELNIPNEH